MHRQDYIANEPVTVVTACDERYVRGAAAAIDAAIASLPTHRVARVYVLDGGISQQSKARLQRSWASPHVEVEWLRPNLDSIRDMPVSQQMSLSAYLRILLAELLPSDIETAIYLDADTITIRNLEELWSVPLEGTYCGAVQDLDFPVLNPREVNNDLLAGTTLPNADPRPILNYQELGLSGDAAYFNSGVMLVNVSRWREEGIARRAFEILRANAEHVRFWDQYTLNILFSGQWKMLDPRWNQNSHVFQLPSRKSSHYSAAELEQIKRDPWIVHFNDLPKPWELACEHPLRRLFFKHLDGTSWRQRLLRHRSKAA